MCIRDRVEAVKQIVADKYFAETGYNADIYVCTAAQGAFAETSKAHCKNTVWRTSYLGFLS